MPRQDDTSSAQDPRQSTSSSSGSTALVAEDPLDVWIGPLDLELLQFDGVNPEAPFKNDRVPITDDVTRKPPNGWRVSFNEKTRCLEFDADLPGASSFLPANPTDQQRNELLDKVEALRIQIRQRRAKLRENFKQDILNLIRSGHAIDDEQLTDIAIFFGESKTTTLNSIVRQRVACLNRKHRSSPDTRRTPPKAQSLPGPSILRHKDKGGETPQQGRSTSGSPQDANNISTSRTSHTSRTSQEGGDTQGSSHGSKNNGSGWDALDASLDWTALDAADQQETKDDANNEGEVNADDDQREGQGNQHYTFESDATRRRAADLASRSPRGPRTSQIGDVETVQEGTPTTEDPHPFGKPPQVIHNHYKNQSNNTRRSSLITGEQQRRPLQYERGFEQRDGFSVRRPSDNYQSWHDLRPPPIDT